MFRGGGGSALGRVGYMPWDIIVMPINTVSVKRIYFKHNHKHRIFKHRFFSLLFAMLKNMLKYSSLYKKTCLSRKKLQILLIVLVIRIFFYLTDLFLVIFFLTIRGIIPRTDVWAT